MRNIQIYIIFALLLIGVFIGNLISHLDFLMVLTLVGGGIAGFMSFLRPILGLFIISVTMLFSPEISTKLTGSLGGIRADDLLIVGVLLGWLGKLAIKKELGLLMHTPLNRSIAIFSLVMIVATLVGFLRDTAPVTAGILYTMKRLQFFFLYFMVVNNINSLRHVKIAIALLFISTGIISIIAITQYIEAPYFRVIGSFGPGQANILGIFFVVIIFLIVGLFRNYRHYFVRLPLLGLFFITFYALLQTRSRASYMSLFLGSIILSFFARNLRLFLIPVLILALTPFIFSKPIVETFASLLGVFPQSGVINPSWEARVYAWKTAIPIIIANPILGLGLGSYDLGYYDCHYVLEVVSLGFVGLGAFLWIIISIFKAIVPAYNSATDPYIKGLYIGFLGGLIGLLIHSVGAATFYTIRAMSCFWFLTGLIMACWKIGKEEKYGTGNMPD